MKTKGVSKVWQKNPGYSEYHANKTFSILRKTRPIEAVTFDSIDLSDNKPDTSDEYRQLSSMIAEMPDKEVQRKMESFINSFPDIEDALVEKIIMEAM